MWCRWLLARLDDVAASSPVALINDLRSSIFRRGDLARRLADAGLADLSSDDQRAIGIAVGRRAARGTGTVWNDGVRQPAETPDLAAWPARYREGVAEGLLVDANGYARPTAAGVGAVVAVLAPPPDGGADELRRIGGLVGESAIAYPVDVIARDEAVAALRSSAAGRRAEVAEAQRSLAESLAALGR